MTEQQLAEYAKNARENAYAPYSGCRVGAALLGKNGKVYIGCNIENSAYSPSVCAERTAFFKAISEGERDFSAIAVAGGKNDELENGFPPCGVCRQVMREFCTDGFVIINVKGNGEYEKYTLKELLPVSFGPEFVKKGELHEKV